MSKQAIVVAGPNGAGKSAFAYEYLESHRCRYVSADVIAEAMAGGSIDEVRVEAGRRFFECLGEEIRKGDDLVVESTLSGLTFKRVIAEMKDAGYSVTIVFVFLGSAEACVARIRERVLKGGHPVREEDVRRRFGRSIRNFWHEYRHLADNWHLCYNGGVQFHDVASGERARVDVRDEGLLDVFLGIIGKERR
ncbi:MAG: AAA family ATPase [Candidatus Eisenbacteria bacterium]